MIQLRNYLKPFLLTIIFIVGLLYVQSQTDLALPDYMSRIVDNGITNNGIDQAAPEAMRESTFHKVTLFLSDAQQERLNSSYTKTTAAESADLVKSYPLLAKEPLYIRNTMEKTALDELSLMLSKPFLITGQIDSLLNDPQKAAESPFFSKLPAGVDPYFVFQQMKPEERAAMQEQILAAFSSMPDSMLQSAAKAIVKQEYIALGIDMEAKQQGYILQIGALMLLIALIGSVATITVSLLSSRVAAGFARNVREALFRKVTSFSSYEFNSYSTASLITRTTNDVQQIQTIIVMLLRMVVYAPIIGFGALVRVIQTNASMSWIIGLVVATILTIILIAFYFAYPRFKINQQLVDRLNLVLRESLSGLSVIRAFNTQGYEEAKFDKANRDITKVSLFLNRLMSVLMPTIFFIMNSVSLLIVWFGAKQIDLGTLQMGQMIALIQYSMQVIMAFLMISMVSIMLPRAAVSAARVAEVLKTDLSIHDPKQPHVWNQAHGLVEFDQVSFQYPGAEETVLHDITFTAKPGEITAFIGSTGSGKSTIINLIPRFFDISGGSLKINGVDIKDYSQHDLREHIGFIPQKATLFSGTIASNLQYGKEDASLEEMKEAAGIAQAMEFISQKELQFEEPISQGGTNVSGGQKQRLSIARALVKKAPIYIFDDTFSALDYKTEANLRQKLEQLMKETKSTVFIIAQRINTIMHADQIIVLDKGTIVGKGTHAELMETCDVYQEIAYSQLSKEELAHE